MRKKLMSKSFYLLILLILNPVTVNATCPPRLIGGYSGYEIHENWTEGKVSNLSTSVMSVRFDKNNTVQIVTSYHTSTDDPIGIQEQHQDNNSAINYSFDTQSCTGRIWGVDDSVKNAGYYFVVADSGKTIYATKQDIGDSETRITILTRQ
jgi:hypothetical protein